MYHPVLTRVVDVDNELKEGFNEAKHGCREDDRSQHRFGHLDASGDHRGLQKAWEDVDQVGCPVTEQVHVLGQEMRPLETPLPVEGRVTCMQEDTCTEEPVSMEGLRGCVNTFPTPL